MKQSTTIIWTTAVTVGGSLLTVAVTIYQLGLGGYTSVEFRTILGLLSGGLSFYAAQAFRFFIRWAQNAASNATFPRVFSLTCISVALVVVVTDASLIFLQGYRKIRLDFEAFILVFAALQAVFGIYMGTVSAALFGRQQVRAAPRTSRTPVKKRASRKPSAPGTAGASPPAATGDSQTPK